MRFVLTHPSETRPSLVVMTCDAITDAEIRRLRDEMFNLGCATGLLFDPEQCVILRDSFQSMSADAIVREGEPLGSDDVLAQAGGGSLDARVNRWLEMMSSSWNTALPSEPATAAPLITDVVPAASGSLIYAMPSSATGHGR